MAQALLQFKLLVHFHRAALIITKFPDPLDFIQIPEAFSFLLQEIRRFLLPFY
jgi:hypothetical protein